MICIVSLFATNQMQSHALHYNGQLGDSQNTLYHVTLYAEVYFLFCSFPILRFFKFYYRKGIIGLIISHCPVQSLEGAKDYDNVHKYITQMANSCYTFCNKGKQKHAKHFSCLTNYRIKTLCKIQEANIYV